MKSITLYPFFLILILVLSCYSDSLTAQNRFPTAGILYDNSSLARVDIAIHPDSLNLILLPGNERNDHEFLATFTFTRGSFSETIDSVGFRLRGNTSRYSAKKSFKVSLNTFIPGQKFDGVEKINLNGEHNDPSISRALLSWQLFRMAGVPGSRANHLRFYINGVYMGLYVNVEHIDEEFVDLRYGNNSGNMYKCLWPADLTYRGTSSALYKFEHEGRRAYELKRTEGSEDDYSDLAEFIRILNTTDPADFPDKLNMIFNVNTYLKNMAIEVLIGHWDAYSYNKNNYYLYFNKGTDKFEFLPYDPDNTFGISWFDDNWSSRDIYNWSHEWEPRPLMELLLQNEIYRDRYSFYMKQFTEKFFNSNSLGPLLDDMRDNAAGAAADDLYRGLDYGYNYKAFYDSFESAAGAHVRLGIKPFISTRSTSAKQQLNVNPIDPAITLLYTNLPELNEAAEIEFLAEDDGAIENVRIWFSNGGDFYEWTVSNRGGGLYAANHPGLNSDGKIRFYIEAADNNMNTTRDPVSGWYTINYGLTSTKERIKSDANVIDLFPNPVQTYFNIIMPENMDEVIYHIYNSSGKLVQQGELLEGQNTIHPSIELLNGLYMIELLSVNKTMDRAFYSEKFILQR